MPAIVGLVAMPAPMGNPVPTVNAAAKPIAMVAASIPKAISITAAVAAMSAFLAPIKAGLLASMAPANAILALRTVQARVPVKGEKVSASISITIQTPVALVTSNADLLVANPHSVSMVN